MIAKDIEKLYSIAINKNALPLKEIELYKFETGDPYIPQKTFYIRCAGDFGIGCKKLLDKFGLKPVAFIDEKLHGGFVEGVRVVSTEEYYKEQNGEEIIVANNKEWIEMVGELLTHGIQPENISVSWSGRYIFSVFKDAGNIAPYQDPDKLRARVKRILHLDI